jgi:hypothetical protein
MYKAMGQTDAWRDGLFSHAAPLQAYQASLNQVNSGSLGAIAVPRPTLRRRFGGGSRRAHPLIQGRRPSMSGLGNTALGAFTEQQMRGLGHYTCQDGSLGDAASDANIAAACQTLQPCMNSLTIPGVGPTETLEVSMKVPFNQIVAASLAGIALYLVLHH